MTPVAVGARARDIPRSASNCPETPATGSRPLLIYDGDCGFCFYWARYWQKLTGDRVDSRPYQQVAAQYPEISEAEFQRAVQHIAADGRRASAAEASFLTLSHAPGKRFWLKLYRHVPGFAPVSEWAYAFIAIPLESLIHAARTVGGVLLSSAVRALAFVLRLASAVAKHMSRVLIRLYDVAIVLPLLCERVVKASRGRVSPKAANDVDIDVERTHA